MIKNVIFDVHKVLRILKDEPLKKFLSPETCAHFKDKPEVTSTKQIIKHIFKPEIFCEYDIGTVDKKTMIKRLANYHHKPENVIEEIMNSRLKKSRNIIFRPMIRLIKKLRKSGIKTYILSNMGEDLASLLPEWLGKENFDDIIFSCDVHLSKPSADIFEFCLNKFNIKAEETMFVDDCFENVEAFKQFGVTGFLFDYKNLKSEIKEIKKIIFQN